MCKGGGGGGPGGQIEHRYGGRDILAIEVNCKQYMTAIDQEHKAFDERTDEDGGTVASIMRSLR